MCGRASLSKSQKEIEQRLQAEFFQEELEQYQTLPNYNIAPTHRHPVITNDLQHKIQFFQWGLIPYWAKNEKIGSKLINARIESIQEKPSFRDAIKLRRCIIPFDGFYEWKKTSGGRIPYRITLKDQRIFCVAGIWENWKSPSGILIQSFSVITQGPNNLMAHIHDRMPAILLPEQEKRWLDKECDTSTALEMIAPYPDQFLKAYTVSSRVNKVRVNDVSLLDEVKRDFPTQGSLF